MHEPQWLTFWVLKRHLDQHSWLSCRATLATLPTEYCLTGSSLHPWQGHAEFILWLCTDQRWVETGWQTLKQGGPATTTTYVVCARASGLWPRACMAGFLEAFHWPRWLLHCLAVWVTKFHQARPGHWCHHCHLGGNQLFCVLHGWKVAVYTILVNSSPKVDIFCTVLPVV